MSLWIAVHPGPVRMAGCAAFAVAAAARFRDAEVEAPSPPLVPLPLPPVPACGVAARGGVRLDAKIGP
jgi:hypothetical protein